MSNYKETIEKIEKLNDQRDEYRRMGYEVDRKINRLVDELPQLFIVESHGIVDYLPKGILFISEVYESCVAFVLSKFRDHLQDKVDSDTLELILKTILMEEHHCRLVEIRQSSPFDEDWQEIEELYKTKFEKASA